MKNKAINDLFSLSLIEKPKNDKIYKDEYFNIILQLTNKTQKNLKLKILYDKVSDRELDVIDIVEKEFELKDKMNVTFICKSETYGNIFFPKLSVVEENLKKTICYEKLFNFICAREESLI